MSRISTVYNLPTASLSAKRTNLIPKYSHSCLHFGATSSSETKPANGSFNGNVYGVQNHGVQSYLPIGEKHALSKTEQQAMETGLTRWWPEIFASYSTPATNLLANPLKSAAISTIFWGGLVGLLTIPAHIMLPGVALLLPLGAGLLGGVLGYFSRKQRNGNILDLMQRLPEGATKRDLLSDPVEQARNASSANNSYSVGSNTGVAVGTALADVLERAWEHAHHHNR